MSTNQDDLIWMKLYGNRDYARSFDSIAAEYIPALYEK